MLTLILFHVWFKVLIDWLIGIISIMLVECRTMAQETGVRAPRRTIFSNFFFPVFFFKFKPVRGRPILSFSQL